MAYSKKLSHWLRNPWTGETIEITATTENALDNKIKKQVDTWEKEQAEWKRQQYVEEQKQYVQQMNEENWRLSQLLRCHMLSNIVRWTSYRYYNGLKRKKRYSDISSPPTIIEINKELKVPIKFGLLELLFEGRKKKRIAAEENAKKVLEIRVQEYNKRADAYKKRNAEYNSGIDSRHEAFASGNPQEVVNYFDWVIGRDCRYIDGYYIGFRPEKHLFYDSEKKMLAVDLKLPTARKVPDIESYEYVEKQDAIKKKRMTQSDFKAFYGHIICEIILRVICVLYKSDEYQLLDTINVNGYRVFLDKSRGKYINDCIISAEFSRKEYEELYLSKADGEEAIRRVVKNVPTDFITEPIHVKPIYDSGKLNVYYTK